MSQLNGTNHEPTTATTSAKPSKPFPSGRPRLLDDFNRSKICTMISVGLSMQAAARMIGCHPSTIRLEARRNPDFRAELLRSKSQAQISPIKTMREAAATNWRAAAWWLERLDPLVFTQGPKTALGKREGNKFIANLTEIIDRVISCPVERDQIEGLLTGAMPAALRNAWAQRQQRRYLQKAMNEVEKRPDPRFDALRTPDERRRDAEFRLELESVIRRIQQPLNIPPLRKVAPPAAGANGAATRATSPPSESNSSLLTPHNSETGGFKRPPGINSEDKSPPPRQNPHESQGPPRASRDKHAE